MNDQRTGDNTIDNTHEGPRSDGRDAGYSDYPLSELKNIGDAPSYAQAVARAVGQLVVTTPRGAHVRSRGARRPLIVPTVKLRWREFVDGYCLYQDTKCDLRKFFDQFTVRAATATLIGPKCILTAAHAVMPVDVRSRNTYFVPYRTNDRRDFGGRRVGHALRIPNRAYYRVRRICGIATKDERKRKIDWAVLELEDEPRGVTPIPVGPLPPPKDPKSHLYTLTHPLGLPLKYSEVKPTKGNAGKLNFSQVLSDFGSGSSGAPMLYYDEDTKTTRVWGVISGSAKFGLKDIEPTRSGKTINPSSGDCSTPQPVTIQSQMRKSDCKDCDNCGC